jgi:hypothetical protein
VEGGLPATSRSGIPWTDGNVQSVEKTELRKLFDGAVRSLNERKPDPDQAIQQILQGVRKDPDNGYWYYLIAAAHVQKGQTEQALQDVKKGNQQAACYLYITRTGMAGIALMGPPLFPMRQLARDLVAQASHPGTEAGAEAILAVRTMGRKIAGQEPRDALSVLLCTHIHTIADQGLVRLYEQAGLSQQAQAARDREARDQQWGDSIRATIKELTAEWDQEWALFGIDIDLFAIDVDEFLSHPPPLPVWKQKMMEELCLKWQAKWRAAAEQALQTMPP